MKFNRLHINHFGRLQNQTLEFDDGIHVIYGPNESGKSTIHAFFESMLFGVERGRGRGARTDAYNRYFPEEGSSTYGGVLEFSRDDTRYSLYRNFRKSPDGFTLMDETNRRPLNPDHAEYRQLISGLTRPLYRNTVSMRQLMAATSDELGEELRSHIVNLRTSGSGTLDLASAKDNLKKQKRALEQEISKDAEHQARELNVRIGELTEDLASHPLPDSLPVRQSEKEQLNRQIAVLSASRERKRKEIEILEQEEKEAPLSEACEQLLEDREDFLRYYKRPLKGTLSFLFILLSVVLFALTVAAFWICTSAFFNRNYPTAAVLLPLCIIALAMFLRLSRIWDANNTYRKIEAKLLEASRELLPEENFRTMTEQSLEKLIDRLDSLKSRRRLLPVRRRELDELTNRLLAAQSAGDEVTNILEKQQKEIWEHDQKCETLRQLTEELEGLSDQLEKNASLREEIAAVELALSTIEKLSVTAFDSFGRYLQDTASRLICQITGGRYTRLIIGDDLHITLEHDHLPIELNRISCSTIDQVYLSLRIACIDFFWPEESMPLLLDESFAMYDSSRIGETLSWLSEYYPGQIFLFTCQHREEAILKKSGIPYTFLSL